MRVYTISGMFAAVSGAISIMRMSSAKPDYGTSYIMFSILICVFGGTHPDGGKGSVPGVVLATLVLQMVSTLMNMFLRPERVLSRRNLGRAVDYHADRGTTRWTPARAAAR